VAWNGDLAREEPSTACTALNSDDVRRCCFSTENERKDGHIYATQYSGGLSKTTNAQW